MKKLKKTATPKDLNITPKTEKALINIVLYGHVLSENLKQTGNDLILLNEELSKQNISDISYVF